MILIPLRKFGKVVAHAKLDDEFGWLGRWRWQMNKHGYVYRKNMLMHRVVLGLSRGDGIVTDHINGDPLDNQLANLRRTNGSGNQQNQTRLRKDNRSGIRGVYWHNGYQRWYGSAKQSGVLHRTKGYVTKEEAAAALADLRVRIGWISPTGNPLDAQAGVA